MSRNAVDDQTKESNGMETIDLNVVQKTAYTLIQADARFLASLVHVHNNAKHITSNFIMMSQPYIGVFADGAEQWCKKVGIKAPVFTGAEKEYYVLLRQGHKLLEQTYEDYSSLLSQKLRESDNYFYARRSIIEKLFGYYNVGTDLCNNAFCGNTINCAVFSPLPLLKNKQAGQWLKRYTVVAGELAAFFGCNEFSSFPYDAVKNRVVYKDYHFYDRCPLKTRSLLGFVLFSILCNINFVTVFLEEFFIQEIPQKFKFAYLQYFYLCDFIKEVNASCGTQLYINGMWKNQDLRNSLAHYGLGQLLGENDIVDNDVLKGLTTKALGLNYFEAKRAVFDSLHELINQIESIVF